MPECVTRKKNQQEQAFTKHPVVTYHTPHAYAYVISDNRMLCDCLLLLVCLPCDTLLHTLGDNRQNLAVHRFPPDECASASKVELLL